MSQANHYETREAWLLAATRALRTHYESAGYPLPERIRFSIGFPSTGRKGKRIGEHWHSSASADDNHEIYIRPDQAKATDVLGILAHELVHSAVPIGSGHGKVFKAAALAVGLTGPMRSAMPGPVLAEKLAALADELGPLPHGALSIDGGKSDDAPKKQSTRMLKAECTAEGCGYTVRLARKWIDAKGPPHCPEHGAMEVEGYEPGEGSPDEESSDEGED
jgi:hypothetical protein